MTAVTGLFHSSSIAEDRPEPEPPARRDEPAEPPADHIDPGGRSRGAHGSGARKAIYPLEPYGQVERYAEIGPVAGGGGQRNCV
jgi:hypothetical protein